MSTKRRKIQYCQKCNQRVTLEKRICENKCMCKNCFININNPNDSCPICDKDLINIDTCEICKTVITNHNEICSSKCLCISCFDIIRDGQMLRKCPICGSTVINREIEDIRRYFMFNRGGASEEVFQRQPVLRYSGTLFDLLNSINGQNDTDRIIVSSLENSTSSLNNKKRSLDKLSKKGMEIPDEEPHEMDATPDEKNICTICAQRKITTTIIDCGHTIMCVTCARQLITRMDNIKCPVCQEGIEKGVIKIYGLK